MRVFLTAGLSLFTGWDPLCENSHPDTESSTVKEMQAVNWFVFVFVFFNIYIKNNEQFTDLSLVRTRVYI